MAKLNLKDATKELVEHASGILEEATKVRKEADWLFETLKRMDNDLNRMAPCWLKARKRRLQRHLKRKRKKRTKTQLCRKRLRNLRLRKTRLRRRFRLNP